ncbi:hypothetical protein BCR36DRAFT_370784 [Piromyces finnis]|uniref:Uncharacterized protein n=1 Tax=Piromyces finnis TaxID=1754191 RepID=A0A1Y1V7F0_9FUNG|nr:hypothetical protein BCR36DRAFT_370784 [Piromyces finnis]|eukprot:ORX49215.1 hypothetical protein BCR36DRAFT_370784 [Piromyces finnis]
MPSLLSMKSLFQSRGFDQYQVSFTQLIVSEFFPWTCLILLLTYKNWKRPIIVLMVLHYLLRCIGDMLERSLKVRERDYEKLWPYGNSQWLNTYGIAGILWHLSEIIGDWYLLIRTKAIIRNTKKIRWVFITCLIYNLVKCAQIYTYLSYIPFREGYDQADEKTKSAYYTLDMAKYKANKWTNVALQQVCSLAYDLSVLIALRKNVFIDKQGINLLSKGGNSFLKKFKQISEYRIIFSIIVTLCGIPLIFTYAIYVFHFNRTTRSYDDEQKIKALNDMVNDSRIDPIRTLILNFSYTFMYIDQVMLKFYIEKQKSSKMTSNTHSHTSGYSGSHASIYTNGYSNNKSQNTTNVSNNYESNQMEIPLPSHNNNIIYSDQLSNDKELLNPKPNTNTLTYYNYK